MLSASNGVSIFIGDTNARTSDMLITHNTMVVFALFLCTQYNYVLEKHSEGYLVTQPMYCPKTDVIFLSPPVLLPQRIPQPPHCAYQGHLCRGDPYFALGYIIYPWTTILWWSYVAFHCVKIIICKNRFFTVSLLSSLNYHPPIKHSLTVIYIINVRWDFANWSLVALRGALIVVLCDSCWLSHSRPVLWDYNSSSLRSLDWVIHTRYLHRSYKPFG